MLLLPREDPLRRYLWAASRSGVAHEVTHIDYRGRTDEGLQWNRVGCEPASFRTIGRAYDLRHVVGGRIDVGSQMLIGYYDPYVVRVIDVFILALHKGLERRATWPRARPIRAD